MTKKNDNKRSLRYTALMLSLTLCLGLFSACGAGSNGPEGSGGQSGSSEGQQEQPVSRTVFALDTVIDLKIYGYEGLLDRAEALINENEARLSVTAEGSEIRALNSGEETELSEQTAELMARALELGERTGGAFDISIYPLVRAWGFTTDEYRVPGDGEIAELLELVDYAKVREAFEEAGAPRVMSLPPGMEIDLGGVAKGCIGQLAADMLKESGVKSALLNLGGNVQTVGAKPDGSPWRVAVQDPFGDGLLGVADIVDKAVITSGGYERFFVRDGAVYWHIIDPKTGRPASSGLISATVIGSDGTLCDALSTACFILGKDGAAELWRSSDDFEAVLVTDDGEVYITEGLEGNFELVEAYAKKTPIVIRR